MPFCLVISEKLPKLYVDEKENKILDDLILLDVTWLTKMMRIVLELQTGRGCKLTNEELHELESTGCAKASLLRHCWNDLNNDIFHQLCLIMQSFCLIFPLPVDTVPALQQSASIAKCEEGIHSPQVLDQIQKSDSSSKSETVYLIPSKLSFKPIETLIDTFEITFVFDFHGFLPVEVYHRLLCLMLKKQSPEPKPKGEFTAQYFVIKCLHKCNWLVEMIGSELRVSVKYAMR